MIRIVTTVGSRLQCINAASVPLMLQARGGVKEEIAHTGQHYDANVSDVLFEDLEIPEPDYNLGIGRGSHGQNTGQIIEEIEQILVKLRSDRVLGCGDTTAPRRWLWRQPNCISPSPTMFLFRVRRRSRSAIEKKMAEIGVDNGATFAGAHSSTDYRDAMCRSSAIGLPSQYETFVVVLIEALSTGLPIVETRSGGSESTNTPNIDFRLIQAELVAWLG